MTIPRLTPHELVARLAVLRGERDGAVLVFDADGTLWSGDVGDDVFGAFIDEARFSDLVAEPLERELAAMGLEAPARATDAARVLLDATSAGMVDRRAAYSAMTWALAGMSPDAFRTQARRILGGADLPARRQRELVPIFDFANQAGIRTTVVSASPRIVVEEALSLSGIAVDHVIAGEAAVVDGVIQPEMARPLPYAEQKTEQARVYVDGRAWLASFGDSDYDLPMMQAAKLGVLVRPKPALRHAAMGAADIVEIGDAPGR